MRIENLRVGMEFKNYKLLCEFLEEEVKNGNSKKAQLETFSRYFSFEQNKNNYIITRIFDKPLPVSVRDDSVYTKYIETILIYILSKNKSEYLNLSKGQLYEQIGLVSNKYLEVKNYLNKSENKILPNSLKNNELKNLSNSAAHYHYSKSYQYINDKTWKIVSKALNSMKSRFILANWYKVKTLVDVNNNAREATVEEDKLCTRISREVLLELNCKNIFHIYNSGLKEIFLDKVSEKLILKTDGKIKYYFETIKLIYNYDICLDALQRDNLLNDKKELNHKAYEAVIKHMKNDVTAVNKIKVGFDKNYSSFVYDNDYEFIQELLIGDIMLLKD